MAWYRAYFLNSKGRISDVEEFRSDCDATALEHANKMLTTRMSFIAIELWQEARPVLLYPQQQAA